MVNVCNKPTTLFQTQLLSFRRDESKLTKKLSKFLHKKKFQAITDFLYSPSVNLHAHRSKMTGGQAPTEIENPLEDLDIGAQGGEAPDIDNLPSFTISPLNSPPVYRREPIYSQNSASTVIYNHIQDPDISVYVLNPASHDFTQESASSYYAYNLNSHTPFDFEGGNPASPPPEPKDDRPPVEIPWFEESQLELSFFYEQNNDSLESPLDIDTLTAMLGEMNTKIE